MTTQRKLSILVVPFQAYCGIALLGLLACRVTYGHTAETPLIMFLAWSCIVSSFLWLVVAAVQAHYRLVGKGGLNALLAGAAMFAAAYLMPYLAKG